MAITEVLQGCGAWSVKWKQRPPSSVQSALVDGSTLLVFDKPVQATMMTDAMRVSALFEGVMTSVSSSGISGFEASWLLGKPDGSGPAFGTSSSSGLFDYVDDHFPQNGVTTDATRSTYNGLFAGIYGPAAGPGTVIPLPGEMRFRLDAFCNMATKYWADFNATGLTYCSWDIAPGLRLGIGPAVDMYRQGKVIISDTAVSGGNRTIVAASGMDVTRSIEDLVDEIVVFGDRDASTGVTYTDTVSWATGQNSPAGTPLVMRRILDGGGNRTALDLVVQEATDDGNSPKISVQVSLNHPWETELSPGDYVYVHSNYEADLLDGGGGELVEVGGGSYMLRGFWVRSMTRNISEGMTVLLRTPTATGTYTDITPYVQTTESPATVSLLSRFLPPYQDKNPGNAQRIGGGGLNVAQRLARSVN